MKARGVAVEQEVGAPDLALLHDWGAVVVSLERISVATFGRVEAETGLSRSSFELVARLLDEPGHRAPLTYLARRLIFSSGGMTKLADRLVDAGLLERAPSPTDRRGVNAALTPKGVAVGRTAQRVFVAELRSVVLAPLGDQQFDQLLAITAALHDRTADAGDAEPGSHRCRTNQKGA